MIVTSDWTAFLEDAGGWLYELFIAPVLWLTSTLATHAPALFGDLTIAAAGGNRTWPAIVACLIWCLLAIAVLKLVALVRSGIRTIGAWIRLIHFRVSHAIRGFKTKLVIKLRQFLPHRTNAGMMVIPDIDMDEVDIAMLRSVSDRGPGFAISAPDLAEEFGMRPAQIQRRLEKLSGNRMLEDVIGSTDGYDNYRLTNSGSSFLAMWYRQDAAT